MAAQGAPNPGSDTSALRRLFERQPACLVRVRLDGVLIACNRASLGFLGGDARRRVVRTNLIDRIPPPQRAQWQDFMRRCWEEGAARLACDLVTRDNEARPALVHGIALKNHPDGVESLLLHLGVAAQSADAGPREARLAELERKLAETQQTLLRRQREYGRDVAMLKSALAAAVAAKTSALAEKRELEAVTLRLEAATAEQ